MFNSFLKCKRVCNIHSFTSPRDWLHGLLWTGTSNITHTQSHSRIRPDCNTIPLSIWKPLTGVEDCSWSCFMVGAAAVFRVLLCWPRSSRLMLTLAPLHRVAVFCINKTKLIWKDATISCKSSNFFCFHCLVNFPKFSPTNCCFSKVTALTLILLQLIC